MLVLAAVRAWASLAAVLVMTLAGCEADRIQRSSVERIGFGYLTPLEETEAALEEMVRSYLAHVHMEDADIDCVVAKIKASQWWRTDPPTLSITSSDATGFADECGVDFSKLYVFSSD